MRLAPLVTLGLLGGSLTAQSVLLRRHGDLVAIPSPAGLRATLETLLRGPTPAQQARGLRSAIPPGTRLLDLDVSGDAVTVRLSDEFLGGGEDAREQVVKTIVRAGRFHHVRVLPEEPAPPVPVRRAAGRRGAPAGAGGVLAGKTIVVSPGHGKVWNSTYGWGYQRPLIDGLREDLHTNEIAMRYLIPALENLGARVISVRERSEVRHERIGDNDQGAPVYRESGTWFRSTLKGYNGGSYRYAVTAARTTATAVWTIPVPVDASYPVYVFFRAGANRTKDALYAIHHTGGVTRVRVDQTRNDQRWLHLGDYRFAAARGARIVLDNQSSLPGRVIVADAVRVGAGAGSIARGGRTSGEPRWRECSRYWAEYDGAPASVYDSSTGGDHTDDVRARPLFAEWRGADAYVSLHTNAGGGTGTSSYIHDTSPTRGSRELQAAVHGQIVADIRRLYDSSWVDRGRRSANFGEVRLLRSMPGVLVELAFHDRAGTRDHRALHDPRFRRIAGRACARGVMRYFNKTAPFPPEPPTALRVTQDGRGGLQVAWDASPGATHYSIEISPDGKGFLEAAQTTATSWSTGPLPHGAVRSFRVRARNASGRSFPTEVLTAGTSHTKRAELLMVQGFDRLDRYVKAPENTRDYLRLHADAIRRSGEFSLGFDAASNEAVVRGRVRLSAYRAVDWALGEESTRDETFSTAEQRLVRAYLAAGGRLLVSGAEIGWDLDRKGSSADRAFYHDVLGAIYVADDARTYAFRPNSTGIFKGLAAGRFDDGTHGTYNVDYADVLRPSDKSSRLALVYATGGGAAIERIAGSARVVNLGFPLETIVDSGLRGAVMARALRFLLSPRALEAPATVTPGATASLRLAVPGEARAFYVLAAAASLGDIPLPGGRSLPLANDGILALSLQPSSPVFVGFQGRLDAGGNGSAAFKVPDLAFLRGMSFYFSGLTATPAPAVRSLLPWVRITVR